MSEPTKHPPRHCRDLAPLSDLDVRHLALWLDALALDPERRSAGLSLTTARSLVATCLDARAKEDAAWDLLVADLTPDTPTDFPKDA